MRIEDIVDAYMPKEKDLVLSPCPFCGNKEIYYVEYNHVLGKRYAVACANCLASIDPGWARQEYQVQDLWNKRIS